MSIRLVTDKENVDYQAVTDILDHFGLSHFDAATEEKIFMNSYATVFIYDGDQVVGCARAISDGVCQAAIKKHYHIDCCPSNEYAIVTNGPDESLWLLPHGREKLSAK